jgi:hypothetical protein
MLVARLIVYALMAVVGLVILIAIGWIAALAFLFLVVCAGGSEWLMSRARESAREHGIFRNF